MNDGKFLERFPMLLMLLLVIGRNIEGGMMGGRRVGRNFKGGML
jgi:hypothetical protein